MVCRTERKLGPCDASSIALAWLRQDVLQTKDPHYSSKIRSQMRWQNEREARRSYFVVFGPDPTTVMLDNRAAHRQPNAHSAILGRV